MWVLIQVRKSGNRLALIIAAGQISSWSRSRLDLEKHNAFVSHFNHFRNKNHTAQMGLCAGHLCAQVCHSLPVLNLCLCFHVPIFHGLQRQHQRLDLQHCIGMPNREWWAKETLLSSCLSNKIHIAAKECQRISMLIQEACMLLKHPQQQMKLVEACTFSSSSKPEIRHNGMPMRCRFAEFCFWVLLEILLWTFVVWPCVEPYAAVAALCSRKPEQSFPLHLVA